MITVVMAEDHQMLIDGVQSFFQYNPNIKIIGTANNGKELLKIVRLKKPRVIVTDIRMPLLDGIQATKAIKKEFPYINILAMTMFDQPEAIKQMLDAGASGYILKNSGIKMLLNAIENVAKGTTFFDPNVAYNFMDDLVNVSSKSDKTNKVILSKREREILTEIAKGKTSKQIADSLFIAKTTVDTHRKNIIRKLDLSSANELIKYAIDSKYDF